MDNSANEKSSKEASLRAKWPKRDPSKEPLGHKFKHIQEKIIKHLNEQLSKDDITFSQMSALLYLYFNNQHPVSMKELSFALQIKHPTAVGLINRLEDKQMVRRYQNPDDNRSSFLKLTDKSRELLARNKEYHDHMDEDLIKGFSKEEIFKLREYLDRVYENMKDY